MLALFPDSARPSSDGELALGGVPAHELAERFGTPLVVYCEETLGSRHASLRAAAGQTGHVFYGTKAFANVAVLAHPPRGGSRGRRRLRGRARVRAGRRALGRRARRPRQQQGRSVPARGSGRARAVVLDAPDEAELAATAGVEQALVRVTLGVDADTHEAIVTGHHGSKFGLPPAQAQELLADALDRSSTCSGFTSTWARSSRLRRPGRDDPPARRVRRLLPRRARLGSPRRRSRGRLRDPPQPRRDVPDAAVLAASGRETARERSPRRVSQAPTIWLEPGRSLVGRAGVTLYRVGAVKRLRSAPGSRSTAGCRTTRGRSSTTRATRR